WPEAEVANLDDQSCSARNGILHAPLDVRPVAVGVSAEQNKHGSDLIRRPLVGVKEFSYPLAFLVEVPVPVLATRAALRGPPEHRTQPGDDANGVPVVLIAAANDLDRP